MIALAHLALRLFSDRFDYRMPLCVRSISIVLSSVRCFRSLLDSFVCACVGMCTAAHFSLVRRSYLVIEFSVSLFLNETLLFVMVFLFCIRCFFYIILKEEKRTKQCTLTLFNRRLPQKNWLFFSEISSTLFSRIA